MSNTCDYHRKAARTVWKPAASVSVHFTYCAYEPWQDEDYVGACILQ